MKKTFHFLIPLMMIAVFPCNTSLCQIIEQAKKDMHLQMNQNDYDNLDWSKAITSSIDSLHPESLLLVPDKNNPNRSLYYSMVDNKENAYLVNIDLPAQPPGVKINAAIEVYSIQDVLLRQFIVEENSVVNVIENTTYKSNIKIPYPDFIIDGSYANVPTSFISMFYSYGGGITDFDPTIPSPTGYGSGGGYTNPFFDKYQIKNTGVIFSFPFVNVNPSVVISVSKEK